MLAAEVRHEPENERKSRAEHEARDDWEINRGVFAAMNHVAGKSSQAKREFAGEIEKRTKHDEESSEKKKCAAEFAQRIHEESVENLAQEVKKVKEFQRPKETETSTSQPARPKINRSLHGRRRATSSSRIAARNQVSRKNLLH